MCLCVLTFLPFVKVLPHADDTRDEGRDFIDNAYLKVTKPFQREKLPRTTLEDIPIPPYYIDLPKELSRMTSMISTWDSYADVGERLASISKLCSTLDKRCNRYRKRLIYSAEDDSSHSKLSAMSEKGESTMFSCGFSDAEQSTEQLEIASATISNSIPEKLMISRVWTINKYQTPYKCLTTE